jgi:ABC-type multidrug transport system fused ATPase/permease subunit
MHTARHCIDWVFWSLFCSGLCFSVYLGIPYVTSGQMKVSQLVGMVFKINCNLSFPIRAILEEIPKMGKLLQPLGRICDLLQANPKIEPNEVTAMVEIENASELCELLLRCVSQESVVRVGEKRTVLRKAKAPRPTDEQEQKQKQKQGCAEPTVGAQLLSLRTSDHEFITVTDKDSIDMTAVVFPVRALFSHGLRPEKFKGKIEFRNVWFSYPTDLRKPVLKGFSFTVDPQQKVALVGSTGCGKSSVMCLLQRLYEPQSGEILIDDIPIEQYDVHFLRSRIVIVDQNTVLFNATIRDNIAYGIDVSDEEVIRACEDAKAWDFINEKPDKLMTTILDGGKNLSGGQRQRLAIARAMVRKPDVILLDEATSALDNENEKLVQKALDKLAKQGSALVIAHRLSTVMDSDNIIVVDKGEKVEEGTHTELLRGRGTSCNDSGCSLPKAEATGSLQGQKSLSRFISKDDSSSSDSDSDGGFSWTDLSSSTELGPPPSGNPSFGVARTLCEPTGLARCSSETSTGSTSRSNSSSCSTNGSSSPRAMAGAAGESKAPQIPRLFRQPSAPCVMVSKTEEQCSYRRLWDAATGDHEAMSMVSMQKKIDEMESQLIELKAKVGSMRATQQTLLVSHTGSQPSALSPQQHPPAFGTKHVGNKLRAHTVHIM